MSEQEIEVRIMLNGNWVPSSFFTLDEGVTVDFVESAVRTGYNISGGFLFSRQDRNQVVASLRAGEVYYFRHFQVPNSVPSQPSAGKYGFPNEFLF